MKKIVWLIKNVHERMFTTFQTVAHKDVRIDQRSRLVWKVVNILSCTFLALLIPLQLSAAEDFYPFNTPSQQRRFQSLTSELRCLVCQNQNLAESNAPLATDLRQQVYLHLEQGQSDKEIIDYLVKRYGNFILYRPPFNARTWGLWLGPSLFLLIGIFYLLFYISQKNRKTK